MTKVITRFAPSPTGTLHIGGVRTALFNYVYAKQNDGLFLVRIEDTDKERSTKEFEKNILDSLSSIGLSPDKEPINQSERNDIYVAAAEKIIALGRFTWPHQMVKMMVAEQIYRIETILQGHPYHK